LTPPYFYAYRFLAFFSFAPVHHYLIHYVQVTGSQQLPPGSVTDLIPYTAAEWSFYESVCVIVYKSGLSIAQTSADVLLLPIWSAWWWVKTHPVICLLPPSLKTLETSHSYALSILFLLPGLPFSFSTEQIPTPLSLRDLVNSFRKSGF
jgi:hypothetical protein